jgi:2-amino-4-hydroxy-6-hydroxymethyldihydropteridine diphosphokinase
VERAYIGLGANLGDARATLDAACDGLARLPGTTLAARSSWYRSAPVDARGPAFVNGVAALDTALEPLALLEALQAIEQRHGRARPYRNAPRTLDLDLLLYGELQLRTERLTLPHPRLHERAFVLHPLAELEPALEIPGRGAVRELLGHVAGQDVERLTR